MKNAEYISVEEYEKRGYEAPENAESESKQPAGLTNPIADIYRAATGEGGDMINAFTNARTGETAARGAGLSEASSDGTATDGAAAGGLSADEIEQLSNASTSKSNKSGSSGRRRSGGRKAGGQKLGRQQHDGGRAHGHGEYTVVQNADVRELRRGLQPLPADEQL